VSYGNNRGSMSGPAVAFRKLTLTCVAGVGIAIGAATTFAIGRMKLVEAESKLEVCEHFSSTMARSLMADGGNLSPILGAPGVGDFPLPPSLHPPRPVGLPPR